jgi:hypothetical protein
MSFVLKLQNLWFVDGVIWTHCASRRKLERSSPHSKERAT